MKKTVLIAGLVLCELAAVSRAWYGDGVTLDEGAFKQAATPPSDLPRRAGYRSVWGHETADAAVRPSDVVVEVVANGSTPFAPVDGDTLRHVAMMARLAPIAMIIALDGSGYVDHAKARVERVLKNATPMTLRPGDEVEVSTGGFANASEVQRVGPTLVIRRLVFQRVPRGGYRYLWFTRLKRDGALSTRMGYGDLLEFRGSRLVPMSFPDNGNWQSHVDGRRALRVVATEAQSTAARDELAQVDGVGSAR